MSDLRDQVHEIVCEARVNAVQVQGWIDADVFTDRIMALIDPDPLVLMVGDRVTTKNPERPGYVSYPGPVSCLVRFDAGNSAWVLVKNLKMES